MKAGEANAIILTGVRGQSLRQAACLLREVGMVFHVNKVGDGYRVWKEE